MRTLADDFQRSNALTILKCATLYQTPNSTGKSANFGQVRELFTYLNIQGLFVAAKIKTSFVANGKSHRV
jgi:hypothetical protein